MTLPSVSPTLLKTQSSKFITLAAGCFWGVEKVFSREFTNKGLVGIKVGYANGKPTIGDVKYDQVCTGQTEFAEAVQISYEPSQVSLSKILDIFFRMHDPTTPNRQGNDRGTQYRSAIMTHDPQDHEIAVQTRDKYQQEWYPNHNIATIIEPINIWHDAELYHQQYLDKNPGGYECSTHFIRQKPKT